jgi:hypothetical protein
MGVICSFYRLNSEAIHQLKQMPSDEAWSWIMTNYAEVNGKYHIEDDTAFETDKAWDIAKFLLKKCDPSPGSVLSKLDGVKLYSSDDWVEPRYIEPGAVKEIYGVLKSISVEQIQKEYNQKEMVDNNVYKADLFGISNWDYFMQHVDTMKKAFARASETGDCLLIYFH